MNAKLYQLSRSTTFTLTALNAETSILTPYLTDQINKLNDFQVRYDEAKKRLELVTREHRNRKKSVQAAKARAIKFLKEISFRVQADAPERYKNYFPVNYSTVITREKSLLKAYEMISTEINLETRKSLVALRDEAQQVYERLRLGINQLTDAKTEDQLLQKEFNDLYSEWVLEYRRLKLMVQAALLDGKTDYQIFFERKKTYKKRDQTTYEPILPSSVTQ